MEIEKITVNVGLTHNMGGYEFLRLDYGMTIRLDQTDNREQVLDYARTACNIKLTKDLEDQIEWLNKTEDRIHGR